MKLEQFRMVYGDKFDKQIELEATQREEARKLAIELINKATNDGQASRITAGKKIVDYVWEDVVEGMKAMLVSATRAKAVEKYAFTAAEIVDIYEGDFDTLAGELALQATTITMNAVLKTELTATELKATAELDSSGALEVIKKQGYSFSSLSTIALNIGEELSREVSLEKFLRTDGKKAAKSIEEGIKKRVGAHYKRMYAHYAMTKGGSQPVSWSTEDKSRIGTAILNVLIKTSGMFEIAELESATAVENKKKFNTQAYVVATEWLQEAWNTCIDKMVSLAFKFRPTIIPPKPWESIEGGGYYGEMSRETVIMRLKGGRWNEHNRNYLNRLKNTDMSYLYNVANTLQNTPYRVNKFVLEVCQGLKAAGNNKGEDMHTTTYTGFAGLPRYTFRPIPELLQGDASPDDIKANRELRKRAYEYNIHLKQLQLVSDMMLAEAENYVQYEEMFFPWNFDFRGRAYPVSTSLHSQGNDLMKSLIEFADPTPFKTENDWEWLAYAGSSHAGKDKLSKAERIQWVVDNETNIVASAQDPLNYLWWDEVAGDEAPLEFLAFCKAWADMIDFKSVNGTIVGFKCGVSVPFDGSCSGLQHFSALLKDETGGLAVNLIPGQERQDIYLRVADKVSERLKKDAVNGTKDSKESDKKGAEFTKCGTQSLATAWTMYNSDLSGDLFKVPRSLVKRNCMTLAYGSTQYRFKQNVKEDSIRVYEGTAFDGVNPNQAGNYMGDITWDAVAQTVQSAVDGMAFLQLVARKVGKTGNPVSWTTPNGITLQQSYIREPKTKKFQARINGSVHRVYHRDDSVQTDIDADKQAMGIAPNFIHSLDASHLQRIVVAAADRGATNLMMIHDSFGTDVANAGMMYEVSRSEFVNMYKDTNLIETFLQEVEVLIPEEELDEVYEAFHSLRYGNLDINGVLDSEYCFA